MSCKLCAGSDILQPTGLCRMTRLFDAKEKSNKTRVSVNVMMGQEEFDGGGRCESEDTAEQPAACERREQLIISTDQRRCKSKWVDRREYYERMVGGSYQLACDSFVPWRTWGPLDTLVTEGSVSLKHLYSTEYVHKSSHNYKIQHKTAYVANDSFYVRSE